MAQFRDSDDYRIRTRMMMITLNRLLLVIGLVLPKI